MIDRKPPRMEATTCPDPSGRVYVAVTVTADQSFICKGAPGMLLIGYIVQL